MTRRGVVKISGMHSADGAKDDIQLITACDYFLKNGCHYVIYEELSEDSSDTVKNMVKMMPDFISIRKTGAVRSTMVFERGKKNRSIYATPMGGLAIQFYTKNIRLEEDPERIAALVDYVLEINGAHVSDCRITLEVLPEKNSRES